MGGHIGPGGPAAERPRRPTGAAAGTGRPRRRSFTTPEGGEAADSGHLDVGRVLLERRGDELLVASLVAAVGQGVGWDVAVIASGRRALCRRPCCGPPLALSIAHEGRLIDACDLRKRKTSGGSVRTRSRP